MLNPYFTLISVVRLGASITGTKLCDNYGFHGALSRFAAIEAGKAVPADGIEGFMEKAESFAFGQICGRAMKEHMPDLNGEKLLYIEALIAEELLMKLSPEKLAKYSPEEAEKNVTIIFRALLKRAQIRTHTAKPGGEDIHAWLASYYELQKEYEACLPVLVKTILNPDAALKDKYTSGFFSKNDPVVALSLNGGKCDEVLAKEPTTVFGKVLRDIAVCSKR